MRIGDVTNQPVAHPEMRDSFKPHHAFTSSLSPPLASSCGSWYPTVKHWVLIIPNALWSLVRKAIYLLTCCKFCGNTLSAKEKQEAIQRVLHVWKDVDDLQRKQEAWTKMTSDYPYLEQILLNAHTDIAWRKFHGEKEADPEEVKKWIAQHGETVKKNAVKAIEDCNVKVLEDYLEYLKPELSEE